LRLNQIVVQSGLLVLLLAVVTAGITTVGSAMVVISFKDRERSQLVYSMGVLIAASASYLVDLSPFRTLSRLAINDAYTGLWQVAVFALFLVLLIILLLQAGRRFVYRA
jgi:ABC-2 type transport system permease protein